MKKTKRDYSKQVLHLPTAWADRWANISPETSEVVNEARITVEKIRADTKEEIAYFPRGWRAQHDCDVMHEREFALLASKKVNKDDLWSNFLVLNRAARLRSIKAAEIRLRQEARQADNNLQDNGAPRRKQRVMKVRRVCQNVGIRRLCTLLYFSFIKTLTC